jgi:hypothetical protein
VLASAGNVTVSDSSVDNNQAGADSAGVESFDGDVTVTGSDVSGNHAAGSGAGVLAVAGDVTVTGSTVAGNTTGSGDSAGIESFLGAVTVVGTTVTGNTAAQTGAGIVAHDGPVSVTNSTVTQNVAGVCCAGVSSQAGSVTLVYSTIVANEAGDNASNVTAETDLTSFGTVVAKPAAGHPNCVVNGTTVSNGYNFDDDGSCGFSATTDHSNAGDPMLGALGNNGGPTQTMLPLAGSPLIDAIPVAACQADGAAGITTDQRGVTRPQGPGCDIGAVELEVVSPAAAVVVTPRFTG